MVRYRGTSGDDEFFATIDNDILRGGDGNDRLHGRDGNDRIIGGLGDDRLLGEHGNDILRGGDGNDEISTGWGDLGGWEIAWGGLGDDRIVVGGGYIETETGVTYGVANARAYGGAGDDEIHGGMGSNLLYGGPGNDNLQGYFGGYLAGNGGDDNLFGSGDVELFGGKGSDRLSVSLAGRSTASNPDGHFEPATARLSGGQGADFFTVQAIADAYSSTAVVSDFRPEEGDRIGLHAFVMGEEAGGSQFFWTHDIYAALDTGADGLTRDRKIDLNDTASGAVSLTADGSLAISFFGDVVVLQNGPHSLDVWMLA